MFSTVRDIMSTMGGYLDYRGGYHNACWDIMSTVGRYNLLLFEYPHSTEHPSWYVAAPSLNLNHCVSNLLLIVDL